MEFNSFGQAPSRSPSPPPAMSPASSPSRPIPSTGLEVNAQDSSNMNPEADAQAHLARPIESPQPARAETVSCRASCEADEPDAEPHQDEYGESLDADHLSAYYGSEGSAGNPSLPRPDLVHGDERAASPSTAPQAQVDLLSMSRTGFQCVSDNPAQLASIIGQWAEAQRLRYGQNVRLPVVASMSYNVDPLAREPSPVVSDNQVADGTVDQTSAQRSAALAWRQSVIDPLARESDHAINDTAQEPVNSTIGEAEVNLSYAQRPLVPDLRQPVSGDSENVTHGNGRRAREPSPAVSNKRRRTGSVPVCALCDREDHFLDTCVGPPDARLGDIAGCPVCNTFSHWFDNCHVVRGGGGNPPMTEERMFELLVVKRQNKPQIRTNHVFTYEVMRDLAPRFNVQLPPWTRRHALRVLEQGFPWSAYNHEDMTPDLPCDINGNSFPPDFLDERQQSWEMWIDLDE